MSVHCVLSRILGEKRIKQSQLAKETGISTRAINALYNDKVTRIDYRILSQLCKALDCDISDILIYIPDKEN